MRCCVPLCTSDNASEGEGKAISFYGFPSEEHLRAAWLRALGKEDSPLPDSAVVCSQHFLSDEMFYETQSGLRQIVAGAIPSTVQVCMICLDTDSKLILMSKHKLEEAYEKLTGHPLCDLGNLKQSLCVQCAQRLINFSRFRDKSLRARALMLDLVEKHELIRRRHIKMINRTKHQLKSSMVLTTLGPDHCDLHILEHPSEDKETELEEIGPTDVVKTEESDDCILVDGDMEEDDDDFGPLKYEDANFQCTLCMEEFDYEYEYMLHMSVHLQNGAGDGECDTSQVCKPHTAVSSSSSHSALLTENKSEDRQTELEETGPTDVVKTEESDDCILVDGDMEEENYVDDFGPLKYEDANFQCTLCLDEFDYEYDYMLHMSVHLQNGAGDGECDTSQVCKPHTAVSSSSSHSALLTENKSEDRQTELEETGQRVVVKTEESDVSMSVDEVTEVLHEHSNDKDSVWDPLKCESLTFQCTLCMEEFVHEHAYIQHVCVHLKNGAGDGECDTSQVCKPHTAVSSSSSHSALVTENKQADPSPCAQAAQTTVAPVSATFATNNENKVHTTNEADAAKQVKRKLGGLQNTSIDSKIFTNCVVRLCDIFKEFKAPRQDQALTKTRKSVSGIQNIASIDFSHQATSQNEVPTTEYIEPVTNSRNGVKVAVPKTLHGKTDDINNIQCNISSQYSSHIAITSFICDICGNNNYKQKSLLVKHKKPHSEVRRFTCKICHQECKFRSHLAQHMRTHTGEKPFTCSICNSKFATRSDLQRHMRIHTGIKPYACELCEYKSANKSNLAGHMRTHTGIKPYACELCEYKSAYKSNLAGHMTTHTGIKPYACELCKYKFANKSNLAVHMKIHTGIKPYACELCKYKFSQKIGLVRHMRIHTGEYSCQICEFKYASKRSLVKHMTTHAGNNP